MKTPVLTDTNPSPANIRLFTIFKFYGVGLGYGGTLGYSGVLLVALVLFRWQIIFSTFWLRYFRFGPIEWIWRQLTYGKPIKILKPAKTEMGPA
jgi:uncharacterized protein